MLDGAPLASGMIRFVPMEGTLAPTNGSRIQDGKFLVSARGGLLPGKYRVEITSRPDTDREPAAPEPKAKKPSQKDRVPAMYNTATTLEAVITEEPTRQKLEFSLRSKQS